MKNLTAITLALCILTGIMSCKNDNSQFDEINIENIEMAYWFEGKRCAFTFTFDDNTPMHKDIGDLLSRYDMKGSFFINAGLSNIKEYLDIYKSLSATGHEIGNHSLDHLNLVNIENISTEKQVFDGARLIEQELGKYPLSFVHPYNASNSSVNNTVFKYHLFSRIASPYNLVNRKIYDVNPQWPAFNDLKDVIHLGKKHWIIIAGHGYGRNDISWNFLESLCKELVNSPDVWVETLSVIGAYDYLRQELQITKKVVDDSLIIEIKNFDRQKYEKVEHLPITIKVPIKSDKVMLSADQPGVAVRSARGVYYFSIDLKQISELKIRKIEIN